MPDILKTIGRYEILREIGRGGMALVYLARQTDLDRFVALKELAAFHASDASFAQRFLRESRVAGTLNHLNIVTVHDYFEHDGTPYIAMEHIERGSLRPYVGHMTLAQVGGVLEGLLAGLAYGEQHGIVHRDLKPENLMVTADGRVKIADFGIAKATNQLQSGAFLTATGTTVGTPTYMAPEQAMAQDIGPWTDLYSVGCMAFELFVGRVPFHDSEAPMAILLRHVNEPIPPARSINPAIDQEISDWVERLLIKDPKERTQSAGEGWDEFEEIIIGLLGPRWRRQARLTERARTVETPKPLTPAPFETTADDEPSGEFESFAWGDEGTQTPAGGAAVSPPGPATPPPVDVPPGRMMRGGPLDAPVAQPTPPPVEAAAPPPPVAEPPPPVAEPEPPPSPAAPPTAAPPAAAPPAPAPPALGPPEATGFVTFGAPAPPMPSDAVTPPAEAAPPPEDAPPAGPPPPAARPAAPAPGPSPGDPRAAGAGAPPAEAPPATDAPPAVSAPVPPVAEPPTDAPAAVPGPEAPEAEPDEEFETYVPPPIVRPPEDEPPHDAPAFTPPPVASAPPAAPHPPPPAQPAPPEGDDYEDFQWRRPAPADIPAPAPPAPARAAPTPAAPSTDTVEVPAAPFPRVESPEPQAPRSTGWLRRLAGQVRKRSPSDAPPAIAEPVVTRRTPHLDLSLALPLRPGAVFEVLVYADRLPARVGEETEDVVLRAPAKIASVRLDVWLVATHHFLITDAPIKTITVRRHEPSSDITRFRVAVVAAPAEAEEPLISASFSCNGRPSGRVTRVVPIQGPGRIATPHTAAAGPILEVDVQAVAPDLVLEISAPENDGRRFEVRVDTPLLSLERRTESWFLPAEAPALVDAAMQQFFAPGASRSARLSSLKGAGFELFDAAPALFKHAYWQLVDAGRKPRTLFVVSDERSIPWELVIPHRRTPGGDREVHRPLGTELAVGRWHRQSGVSPRQRVPLRTSYVVAPNYRTSARLEHAEAEAEFVCSRFSGRRIEPARFDHLDLMLGDQGVDLLHFICHGEADESEIQVLLLEEPDRLHPQQIRAMPGLSKAFRESRPLVFLNACELGRPARGLVGASGFAKSFIEIDASCVVGALWSVDDRTAHNVAVEFYEQILSDPTMPFAEALRRIRARGYAADGEDTYAAYCFYGDPAASSA
jgi:hypothetical protein